MLKLRSATSVLLVLASMMLAGVLAACGSPDPTPTPIPSPDQPAPGEPTDPADETSFEAQWEELIAKAQEDGSVELVLGGSALREFRPIFEVFSETFGVRVVGTGAGGGRTIDRVLAERLRGRYTADGGLTGGSSADRLMRAEALVPILDHRVPGIIDVERQTYTERDVFDDRFGQFLYGAHVDIAAGSAWVWYNTNLVSQEEINSIQSYDFFLDPAQRGRLGAMAPGGGGPMRGPWHDVGEEWVLGVFENVGFDNTTVAGEFARAAEDLAQGRWAFLINPGVPGETELFSLQQLGLPVAQFDPEGTLPPRPPVSAIPNNAFGPGIIDRAPHPNAIRLFANWWYWTEEGIRTYYQYRNPFDECQPFFPNYRDIDLSDPSMRVCPEVAAAAARIQPEDIREQDEAYWQEETRREQVLTQWFHDRGAGHLVQFN